MRVVRSALVLTFREWQFRILFGMLWVLFVVMIFYLPVDLVPGNDVRFQATLFTPFDYVMMVVVGMVAALAFSVQMKIFVMKVGTRRDRAKDFAVGSTGIIAIIISSLFATATCALCVGALFSFLGFGVIAAFVTYRWYIFIVAFGLLLLSLYLASKRLVEGCEACEL